MITIAILAAAAIFSWWMATDAIRTGSAFYLGRIVYRDKAPRMFGWALASYRLGAVGAAFGAVILAGWKLHLISN